MLQAIINIHPDLLRRLIRILKFATVGTSGVIVNSGLLYFFTEIFKIDYKISAIIAIEISIINNFFWNTLWTWSDKKITGQSAVCKRFIKFQVSTAAIALVNYGILIAFTELLHVQYLISNIIGIIIGSTLNFFIGHFWIFRVKKSIESAPSD